MSDSFKDQIRRPAVIIAASGIIAFGVVAYAVLTSSRGASFALASATLGPVSETVIANGTVKAAQEVDLSFQTAGRISEVRYDVGAHVPQGATIALVSGADQEAQLEQAKATLAMQQAKLDSLKSGATPQAVAAAQTAVTNAQTGVNSATQSVIQTAEDAYVKADDAIHNRVEQLFENPRSANPILLLRLSDSQALISIESSLASIENELASWKVQNDQLSMGASTVDAGAVITSTRKYLSDTEAYLNLVSSGLSNTVPTTAYPLATIQGYASSIATARSNLSTSLSGLNTSATALAAANSALQSALAQEAVVEEGATQSDLSAQEAQVLSAQAAVDYASAQLAKTAIIAPISGTITVNNAHAGSTASVGTTLFSMISDSQFQFETLISEADLAKLAVGQGAAVSLSAYPDAPFAAHVISIDPASTVTDGVASYKVTLQFDANDTRIRAGMSGSAEITAANKAQTLFVPSSSVIRNGVSNSVLKVVGNASVLTPVSTGISGDGKTEILSGLQAGDKVRTFGQN